MTTHERMYATITAKEVQDALRLIFDSTVASKAEVISGEASTLLLAFMMREFKTKGGLPAMVAAACAVGNVIGFQRALPKLQLPTE